MFSSLLSKSQQSPSGNLLEERNVPKSANLMAVFSENRGADFVLRTMPLNFVSDAL